MILEKLETYNSAIFHSGNYQLGFKKFRGTQELITYVLVRVKRGGSFIFVDFMQAFDGINRR